MGTPLHSDERLREEPVARRGARAAESDGLENRCGGNLTVGSNPTPSATGSSMRVMGKLRLFLSIAAAAAIVASGSPAKADASWEDPAGDANAFSIDRLAVESTPRPSDPELDIRQVAFTLEGDSIVATTSMEAGGFASASGGSVWRFHFGHKDDQYFFQAQAGTPEYSQVFTSVPRFYRVTPDDPDPTSNGEELRCDCKMTLDLAKGNVRFAIKTASVAKTLRTPLGSLELKELEMKSYRRLQWYLLADVAPAPEGMTFRA